MIRTRSQEKILNLLKTLKEDISAQDIYIQLRNRNQSMGLATVYRSLEALKLEGMVQVRILANGEAVYNLTQKDEHYLTCLRCGTSIPIPQCPVHNLKQQLETSHKFNIFYHTLEFFGLCSECQGLQANG